MPALKNRTCYHAGVDIHASVLMAKWEVYGNSSALIYTSKMIKNKCIEESHLHSFWIPSIHSIVQLQLLNFLFLVVIIIGHVTI